jgi:hypothetical protein
MVWIAALSFDLALIARPLETETADAQLATT